MSRPPRLHIPLADNPLLVVVSVIVGFLTGRLAPGFASKLGVISQIYIDLLKMIVLPFMMAAVLFSLRKLLADRRSFAILPRVALALALTFLAAAGIGLLAGLLAGPGRNLPPEHLVALGKLAGTDALGGYHDRLILHSSAAASQGRSLESLVLAVIPENIFTALNHGETLKVMAFSLMFGLAVGRSEGRSAETLADVLETVYQACLRLTEWFNMLLPAVLFSVVADQTVRTGLGPLQAMGRFLVALSLGALLLVLLALGILCRASARSWPELLRSQRMALLMAMITRYPNACMPTMVDSLVGGLGFARSRIELLVPMGLSLVKAAPVLYIVLGAMFTAQLYGAHLGAAQLARLAGSAMLVGLGSVELNGPSTRILTGLVCTQLQLPCEAALILIAAVGPVCEVLLALVAVSSINAFAAASAGLQGEATGPSQGEAASAEINLEGC